MVSGLVRRLRTKRQVIFSKTSRTLRFSVKIPADITGWACGTTRRRLLHAAEHSVVAHKEDGSQMFNFSEWLGTVSGASLANLYHPGNRRGFSPTAERVGYAVASDIGFDVLREFWPEIARKMKLLFRGQH